MEFRLLGPLEVRRAGAPIALGGPREQLVLAALLLRANETASIPYLVESVWPRPPASPQTNLRTYVTRLRRRLGRSRLVTVGGGYLLQVQPGELDLVSFREHVDSARSALVGGDVTGGRARF
jgi:DNA-binding SARP family transcriptional activator